MKDLERKVVIVTGASKGIGAAIARKLGDHRALVVVNYLSAESSAAQVVETVIASGGGAIAVRADISKTADIALLFEHARRHFGHVDILINNAGIFESRRLNDITEEYCMRQFSTNVCGALLCCQEAVRGFGDSGGTIVNISSASSIINPPYSVTYNASKAALDSVTHTLAKELARRHIRVNSVNPGLVDTDGLRVTGFLKYLQKGLKNVGERMLTTEEVASTVLFLASDISVPITGQIVTIVNPLGTIEMSREDARLEANSGW